MLLNLPFRLVRVNGDSMWPTLHSRDLTIVRRRRPRRGDVVAFLVADSTGTHSSGTAIFIDRLLGLGGDAVAICAGAVCVKGVVFSEPYLVAEWTRLRSHRSGARFTVEANHLFFLGDNRDQSLDSRRIGSQPESAVLGVVVGRIWRADKRR